MGAVPATALYFGSYEYFKSRSYDNEMLTKNRFVAHLAGGMFAEAISCIIFVPVDVIKERR